VKIFNRMTLSARLTLLAVVAMVPLAALLVMQHLDDRQNRKDAGLAEGTAFAQNVAIALDRFATDVDSFTAGAAITLGKQETIDFANTHTYLTTLAARYPNLSALFVTNPQGYVISQAGNADNTGYDLTDRKYVHALQSGEESVWTGGITGAQTGEVIGTFGRVIKAEDGSTKGFLIAVFQPSNLLAALPPDFPRDADLFLVDQNGQFVFSSQDPNLAVKDASAVPSVQTALSGQLVQVDGQPVVPGRGDRYGAVAPIPHMGWVAGYTRSSSVLAASLREDLLEGLGVLALIMAGVIVAMLLIARQMTRPLKSLASAAREMGEGHTVSFAPQRHPDPEVSDLQRALARMQELVAGREQVLRERADSLSHLEEAGATIASGLEFNQTVQAVTDAGIRLTGASTGAFIAVAPASSEGESQSEAMQVDGALQRLVTPGNETLYEPIFAGEGPIRVDDLTQDSRFSASSLAQSNGHQALRSYLAVPVLSAQGGVIGGLFFGHTQPASFGEERQEIALRIAAWASIALDNARLYDQSRVIEEELRQANAAKDEFLGLISHELRTPVTTIYGGLRILHTHKDLMEGDQADELIESMAEEGARLVRLIEDLLALTRVELGREIEQSPVMPNEAVRETLQGFARQKPSREVKTDLEGQLPLISVEPTYFRQVLTNLLSNADKYSPIGQPIEVKTGRDGQEVWFRVTDSGPGVDSAEVDRIFESFYRSEKTSGTAPGQGLGLTVCRKLVEAQGGSIRARNVPDGGFSVTFAFPAMEFEDQEDTVGSDQPEGNEVRP
jgi:signal transduction histidine kinase